VTSSRLFHVKPSYTIVRKNFGGISNAGAKQSPRKETGQSRHPDHRPLAIRNQTVTPRVESSDVSKTFISALGEINMISIRTISPQTYLLILGTLFLLVWLFLAIEPYDRQDWALENILVFAFAFFMIFSYKRLPLSRISYTLIFIFLVIHETGAHYTYAKVPYDAWFHSFAGTGLNDILGWERNNFDRIAHFSYGLLLAYPIREFYFRVADADGFWGYFLPFDFTMSTSMLFELFEWFAAELFGGELGVAYLGTQGDIWDAHKDMALASLGALVAMLITLCINLYLQKDFSKEWDESIRIKHSQPLGEDEIVRLWKKRKRS